MNYYSSIFFVDNKITLNYKDLIINKMLKKAVNNGIIEDQLYFIKEYKKILKENKISPFLINKNIIIVCPTNVSNNDLSAYKSTFENLGYNQVKIITIRTLLELNKKEVYLLNNQIFLIDNYNVKKCITLDNSLLNSEKQNIIYKRCKNKTLLIINSNLSFDDALFDYYYLPKDYLQKILKIKLKNIS